MAEKIIWTPQVVLNASKALIAKRMKGAMLIVQGEAQRKLKESGWGEYRRKQAHLVKLEGRFEARQEVVAARKAQREGERAAAVQAAAEAAQKASQEHREKVVAEAKRVLANLEPEALAQA